MFKDSLRVLECMWSTIDYASSRFDNNSDAIMRAVLGGKVGTAYLTRSNSTASSTISLRLLRELCANTGTGTGNGGNVGRVGLRAISNDDCFGSEEHDEDLLGMDESMSVAGGNKSRHQSQNSQISTAPTNNTDVTLALIFSSIVTEIF